ncbi:MAG: hypothetical protein R3A48_08970 [Polyangiales bacterium]
MSKKRFIRAAGYVFVWESDPSRALVDLEMFREDASGRRRFFVAKTQCAPRREVVYARAMAMVAWLRSLDVPARRDPQAQAVLEQIAVIHDRLKRLRARSPATGMAVDRLIEGRTAAA